MYTCIIDGCIASFANMYHITVVAKVHPMASPQKRLVLRQAWLHIAHIHIFTYTYMYLHILTFTYMYLRILTCWSVSLCCCVLRSAVAFFFYSLHYRDTCTFCGASRSLLRQVSGFCSWQPPGALFGTFSCHVLMPLNWTSFGPFLDHFGAQFWPLWRLMLT